MSSQTPELSREEKLQLRKEKKQQKKKKRSEKGPSAEAAELGAPPEQGQPRGERRRPRRARAGLRWAGPASVPGWQRPEPRVSSRETPGAYPRSVPSDTRVVVATAVQRAQSPPHGCAGLPRGAVSAARC